nr:immunoglobulin light chain junction region [Macaca mulatta]
DYYCCSYADIYTWVF